ncbi:MAG: hypothetical protein RJA22_370 [Verrucomicrobiota bacterium]
MTIRFPSSLAMLALALSLARPAGAATTNFFTDFEVPLSGWVLGDGNPAGTLCHWGVVDAAFGGEGARGGAFKAYCAAVGYSNTVASPFYRDNATAYLARTVDLTGYTNATLSFWSKIPSIEAGYDVARVYVDATEIWSTSQAQTNWTQVTLGLESHLGGVRNLKFEFLTDGSVTREGWYLDDILLTDGAAPVPPPANDALAAAQVVAGSTGSAGGTTRGATAEAGEPDPGNSIWFRWTAYTNGTVTFRTEGSAFDTVLCAYTGGALGTLARVACDDNGGSNGASVITFTAAAGMTYQVSVRGAAGAEGFALLSWDQPAGAGPDLLPDLWVLADAARGYLYGWYLDQQEATQPGRTLLRVATATPNTGPGNLELRGSSTAPGVYQRIFRADGGSYERYAGTFTFHEGHGHLHFDNWINLHLRRVLTNDGVGEIVASGDKTSFAIIDLSRYSGSRASQYNGGLIQGLTSGWMDIYSANLLDQWIDVTAVPSGRYWLESVVDPANRIVELNESNNATRILIDFVHPGEPSLAVPANDSFTNAFLLEGRTAGGVSHNTNATRELNEPAHWSGTSSARSVWWRWTAPVTAPVVINTDGSSFDTILAIYTGSGLGSLAQVGNDDDSGAGNNSQVTLSATAGTTYHIAVDGYSSAVGGIQLHLNPAQNNAFANCLALAGPAGSASGSTRGATREPGEPLHAGVTGSSSIWFCWTAPFSGSFTFDTLGSSFDTLLAIYTGSAVGALTPVAADNNGGSNGTSRATFTAVSNTAYRIAVDGAGSAIGVVRLNWAGPAAPTISASPLSTNAPAGATVAFRVTATGSPTLAYQWRREGVPLADGDYVEGAQTPILTLRKILPPAAGLYDVVVSNPHGATSSIPANLIVLDNPRVIHPETTLARAGETAAVPLVLETLGDENTVRCTLLFPPALLGNPRVIPGHDLATATLILTTNDLAAGRLGLSLALPAGQTLPAAHETELAHVVFEVAPAAVHGTEVAIGFGDSPVARALLDGAGRPLTALFAAGLLTVDNRARLVSTLRLADGRFQLTLAGPPGRSLAVEGSANLRDWVPLGSLIVGPDGTGSFMDTGTAGREQRFYRVVETGAP